MRNLLKILPVIVIMIFVTACGDKIINRQETQQNENKRIQISGNNVEQYLSELRTFGGNEDNFIYSPISLNSALNMYEHVGDGARSKKAIDEFIFNRYYLGYEYDSPTYTSTNRIWKNKEKNIKTDSEVYEYVYELDMSDSQKATKEKNDFVSECTHGFIESTPTIFDQSTVFDIMNITYFKDKWKDGDLYQDYQPMEFKNSDGTVTKTRMLNYRTDYYYENETAYGVPVRYENGCDMIFILPKMGIEKVSLKGLLNKKNQIDDVFVKFPEFEMESQFNMDDYFSEIGIKKPYENMSMGQIAKIRVDKEGTEAAAVTEMMKATGVMEERNELNLTFDEPFYYMIYDYVNNDVAFMGKLGVL